MIKLPQSNNHNDSILVTCDVDIPANSYAYIKSYDADTDIYTVIKPTYYSMVTSRLCIIQNAIKAGKTGIAFTSGMHYVSASTTSGVCVDMIAGTNVNQWTAYPGGSQGYHIVSIDTSNTLFLVNMDVPNIPIRLTIYEDADSNGFYKAYPSDQTKVDTNVTDLVYKVSFFNIMGNLPSMSTSYFTVKTVMAYPVSISSGYIMCYALSNLPFKIFIE
jgi:hypothetical protein